jgi:integrase
MPEIERLIDAARDNRHGHRDALMITMAFRHGLRAAELCDLQWEQVDFKSANLHVRRLKGGTPSTHQLDRAEVQALRQLHREAAGSRFIFISERGAPFTTAGFGRMVERAGKAAGLKIKIHGHMLRHSCGFALANRGKDTRSIQGYLGHKSIVHTCHYTALAPNRFKGFWD